MTFGQIFQGYYSTVENKAFSLTGGCNIYKFSFIFLQKTKIIILMVAQP